MLALDQIQSLSFREFHYLTEAQTPLLSADQVATIPNSWWFGRMSVEARAAITPEQVRSLAVAEVGVGSLTLDQVRALSRGQIQSLDYREFGYLTPEQIVNLTTEQVASIPNEWWFTRSSEEARAALTGDQVRALNVSEIHLGALTESQRAELSVEQIHSLTDEQVQSLNVGTISIGYLSPAQQGVISVEQIQSLSQYDFQE